MTSKVERPGLTGSGLKYVVGRFVGIGLWGVALFAAAGDVAWGRAWWYLGIIAALQAAMSIVLILRAPETLNQRGVRHRNVPAFDKAFAVLWLLLGWVTAAVCGLDVVRYGWSSMPSAAAWAATPVLIVAVAFATWAMIENEHFELLVRIQEERAHRVVTTGPYRLVRHPGYVGAMVGTMVTPLFLGSWWGLVPATAIVLLFVVRTALEDATLRHHLDGYADYAKRTRYRLFPGIW